MHLNVALLLGLATSLTCAKPAQHRRLHQRQNGQAVLDKNNIQIGSQTDGTKSLGFNVAAQKASATDPENFINFCSGKTKTNGLQILTGSCNGVVMGDLPAKENMVSAMITFPEPGTGSNLQANQDFAVVVQVSNLVAGFFTNAVATYYTAPQTLQGGKVVGHTHITIENMGDSLTPKKALDPTKFAYFKGINDAGDGNGRLQANVTGGLAAGNYRVCSITTTMNHACVNMPVAQRGAVDDCTKFTVGGTGGTKNNLANDGELLRVTDLGHADLSVGAGGIAAAKLAADAVALGPGAIDPNGGASSSAGNGGQASTSATGISTSTKSNQGGAAPSGGASSSSVSAPASGAANSSTSAKPPPAGAATTTSAAASSATSVASGSQSATGSATSSAGASTPSDGNAVGGIGAPPVVGSGDPKRPFACDGNTFVNEGAAKQRSCDKQFNACANAFNGGRSRGRFNMGDCQSQQSRCIRGGR